MIPVLICALVAQALGFVLLVRAWRDRDKLLLEAVQKRDQDFIEATRLRDGDFIAAWRERDQRERDERQLLLQRIQAPDEAITQLAIEMDKGDPLLHVPMDDEVEFAKAREALFGLREVA